MGWFTGCVLYALIWWTALFAILPLGVHSDGEPDPVTGWRGAPIQPNMGRKILLTTLVAAIIWGLCAVVIISPWLSFRSGWLAITNP